MTNKPTKNCILEFSDIYKKINSIKPRLNSSLILEIFYYLLLSTGVIIQYFCIFKFVNRLHNSLEHHWLQPKDNRLLAPNPPIQALKKNSDVHKDGRPYKQIRVRGHDPDDLLPLLYDPYLDDVGPFRNILKNENSPDCLLVTSPFLTFSYAINFIFYLTKETNRKRSISLVQEFKYELRTVSIRLVEVIYFIFFLPLAAKHEKLIETPKSLLMSYNMSFCCMINLTFFLVFNSLFKKMKDWKIFAKMCGFWREITLGNKRR